MQYELLNIPAIHSYKEDLEKLYKDKLGSLRTAPSWLGNFKFYYGPPEKFSERIQQLARHIWKFNGDMDRKLMLNTLFFQVYPTGAEVLRHRDPANNLFETYIIPFGTWTGGELEIEQKYEIINLEPKFGDIIRLDCTTEKKFHLNPFTSKQKETTETIRGPYHRMQPITSGVRKALILNYIK